MFSISFFFDQIKLVTNAKRYSLMHGIAARIWYNALFRFGDIKRE